MADQKLEDLKKFVGTKQSGRDIVTAHTIGKLAATLDVEHPAPNLGDKVPHGWHGGFFPNLYRKANMREDGQAAGGGVNPPIPLPRRRIGLTTATYHDNLRIGDEITRTIELKSLDIEDRGAGPLVISTTRDSISTPRGLAVVEERSAIAFGPSGPGKFDPAPSPPPNPAWKRECPADLVQIWRLCAFRFNSHRIHFDRDYTTKKEGYAGIVVPVTLVSQQMIEMCRQNVKRELASFAYRSIEIVVDTGPYTIVGQPSADGSSAQFWCINAEKQNALHGEARFK
jgi:3-methylfumaryl-CoA hydratase